MAEIRPFRGVYYNQSLVGNLSDIICPPYDIINPQLEEELYQRSKYNFVRIEYNRKLPQDSDTDNRYTRSGDKLKQWLEQKVLITSKIPAIYVYDHYFNSQGKEYRRRGLIVRVKIEEWHKNIIRPHEGTLAEAKSDRINLLETIKANTSSIMSLYEDREKRLASLLESQKTDNILISTKDDNGERHEVWQVDEPKAVSEICDNFADKALYIADGHHRYESALVYKRQMLAGSSAARENAAFNFVMMTLVEFNDPGLIILPPHRLLRGLPESKLAGLCDKLESFFDIECLSLDMPDLWQRVDGLLADKSKVKMILFGPDRQNLSLLTLRDIAAADRMIPYFHSEIYKRLDVSIVDHVILEELLGLSSEDEIKISYNYDRRDAVNGVLNKEYQLAFIVSPVKAETIKEIADAGDRMPRKSTYFYPKLPSGLIINRLV
ncbi:MAG: DUF1015 domain-containing protein [Chloroflexota bacterium]